MGRRFVESPLTSPSLSSSVAVAAALPSLLLFRLCLLAGRLLLDDSPVESGRFREKTFWKENCRLAMWGGGLGGASESLES
jgi:hypothetical protein